MFRFINTELESDSESADLYIHSEENGGQKLITN